MSIDTGYETRTLNERLDSGDIEIVHTYCPDAPPNLWTTTIDCCGNREITEPDVDPGTPITCPICAELEGVTARICACWRVVS